MSESPKSLAGLQSPQSLSEYAKVHFALKTARAKKAEIETAFAESKAAYRGAQASEGRSGQDYIQHLLRGEPWIDSAEVVRRREAAIALKNQLEMLIEAEKVGRTQLIFACIKLRADLATQVRQMPKAEVRIELEEIVRTCRHACTGSYTAMDNLAVLVPEIASSLPADCPLGFISDHQSVICQVIGAVVEAGVVGFRHRIEWEVFQPWEPAENWLNFKYMLQGNREDARKSKLRSAEDRHRARQAAFPQ